MATETQTKQTIDALIRAQCPLIAITSREEQRVLKALREVAGYHKQRSADGQAKPVIEWSASFGFEYSQADLPASLKNKKDPMQALEAILSYEEDRAIFVLKDFHPFFQNARVVRLLKDIAHTLVNRPQSVILLSPAFRLPPEIENSVSLVDYPLPDLDDLRGVLSRLEEDLGDRITFDFNGQGQDREQLARALQGLTLIEAMTVLKQGIIAKDGVLNVEAIGVVLEEKKRIVNRSGVLEYWDATANYDDVGGLDNLKAYLREAELSLTEEAQAFGLEPVRGVLVGGIPGTGKSLVAKACAGGRHPRPLLKLSISEVMASGGGIVGQGQARLQQALKVIDSVAPCVVWVDEVDKMFGGGELDGGTRQDMLADLLTWMQETTAPVFIVATANDVEKLPVEFVRRFDERFFVDLPGPRARAEIFEVHLIKRGRQPEMVELSSLVKAAAGFTGSEIENAVKGGLRKAFVRVQAGGEGDVTTDDILAATGEIKPISKTMAGQLDSYRRWDARRAASEDLEIETAEQVMLEL